MFRQFRKVVSDCLIKELNYNVADVSIACDDEQIEVHKMFEESENRYCPKQLYLRWTLIPF